MKNDSTTMSPATPPARGWNQRRLVRTAAIIVVSLLLIFAIVLCNYWPFSQSRVVQAVTETFPGTFTLTNFRSTWFPTPGCVAEGIVFRPKAANGDSGTVIAAQRISIQARYIDMLLRPGYVAHVVVEALRVQVPPIGTGAAPVNPSPTRVVLGEVTADNSVLEIARHDDSPLKFAIRSLRMYSVRHQGAFAYEVSFVNPVPSGEVHSKGHFGPWNENDTTQTHVKGTYTFDHANLGEFEGISGTLSSEGEFQGTLGRLNAQGKIEIPDFKVTRSEHNFPLHSQYQAVINAANGDVTLTRVDSTFLKTRVLGKGTVAGRQGASGKFASIDLAVANGRIQDILWMFVHSKRAPLNGVTDFRAHVLIPPTTEPFLKKVRLAGDFGVQDAQFTKDATQASVVELSERGAGKKPSETEDTDPDDLVSELSGHVELTSGVATFSEFRFQVPDAKTNMHGTYSLLDEKIDLHGTLFTTAKFSNTTTGFKSILLKPFDSLFKRKHHDGAKIPVQLTGTYRDPHAGVEIIK